MDISDILKGHLNEMSGVNKTVSEQRMQICKECLLYKESVVGPICNSKIWVDFKTGDISTLQIDGYVNGCGCRLKAKTTLSHAHCPAKKW